MKNKPVLILSSILVVFVMSALVVSAFLLGSKSNNSKNNIPVAIPSPSPTLKQGIGDKPTPKPKPKASTKTVYVQPASPRRNLTRCQQMYRDGFSYTYAYDQWIYAGYPSSWDVDHDGMPCENSYGQRNSIY